MKHLTGIVIARIRKKNLWNPIVSEILEERYRSQCRLLEEAGIDYRVFMDADDPQLVYLRNYFKNPDKYRMKYRIYVLGRDYRKACRVLGIYKSLYLWGCS